ncbi:hypothetical protein NQ117_21245 [Paenibacillus sp. SC116]|nr:hypothetical protein [Paenibacillus sp. SC116]
MLLITEHNRSKPNVVLFPKTYEYYQMELTRMLESERYAEAVSLLKFLLQCSGDNEESRMEWQALLEWLLQAFPYLQDETEQPSIHNIQQAEEDVSEQDVVRSQVLEKQQMDEQYIAKMLERLQETPFDERKWFILEQLTVAEDANLNDELIYLLETKKLHPIVQFGILQTLCKRGMTGAVTFYRGNEQCVVDIEHTPLEYASYPSTLLAPAERVHEVVALREPSIAYFAQEIWHQFIKAIYGTSQYAQLRSGTEVEANAWAAALHRIVAGLLQLQEEESVVKQIYHINSDSRIVYEQALRSLAKSFRAES